jgi:predicted dehydrogenase
MIQEKVRICLVGCGMIGRVHAQVYQKLRNRFDLYICDADREVARAAQEEFEALGVFSTYEEVLSDSAVEAVDLCLPHHLHMEAALSAFSAGKHVLLEKPISNSLAEADTIIAAAEQSGMTLAISENFRFEPGIGRARAIIGRGDIGVPFLVQIQEMLFSTEITTYMAAFDWRRRESTCGGGFLFDRGVHLMAAVNQLGGPVQTVYAVTRTPAKVWEVDETSAAIFIHKNGVVTNLIESCNVRSAPQTPFLAVYGTEGSIVEWPERRLPAHGPFEIGGLVVYSAKNKKYQGPLDRDYLADAKLYLKMMMNTQAPDDVLERTLARGVPVDLIEEFSAYSVYESSILDFAECIRTEKQPHVGGAEARADIELVFACYESARMGLPVTLPLRY